MAGASVTLSGLADVVRTLRRLSAGTRDASEILGGAVDRLVSEFAAEQFQTEGAKSSAGVSAKWMSHTETTAKLRTRPGHGRGGIGRDTNRLWASLVKSQGADSVKRVSANTLERGTTVPYARHFFEGHEQTRIFGRTRQSPRTVPGRAVFPDPMPQTFERAVQRVVDDFFTRAARS